MERRCHWYYPRHGRFDSGFTGRVKFGTVTYRLLFVEEGLFNGGICTLSNEL